MKKMSLAFVLISAVTVLSSCNGNQLGDDGKGYQTDIIRINDSNSYASCVQAIMRSRDLLEAYLPENVSIEWTSIANSAEIRDAVVVGGIDLASVGSPAVITAIENQAPLTIISATAGAPVYLYSNNDDIKEFGDINENTRVTVMTKSGASHIAFLAKSQEVFGDASIYDDNLVMSPDPETLASLATSKEIDCAFFGPPSNFKANEIEHLTIIEDLTPIILDYGITSYFVTNNDFYENNPVLIEAFRRASQDAVEFINANPKEASSILAEVYEISPEHLEESLTICPPSLEVAGYDKVAGLLYDTGILEKEPMKISSFSYYEDIPIKIEAK